MDWIVTLFIILMFVIIASVAFFYVLGHRMGREATLLNPNIVDLSDLPVGCRDGIKICIDIERNHYASKNQEERQKGKWL